LAVIRHRTRLAILVSTEHPAVLGTRTRLTTFLLVVLMMMSIVLIILGPTLMRMGPEEGCVQKSSDKTLDIKHFFRKTPGG